MAMTAFKLTPVALARACELRAAGVTQCAAAALLGVSPSGLCQAMQRAKLGPWRHPRKLAPAELAEAVARIGRGETAGDVAASYGVRRKTLYHSLARRGQHVRWIQHRARQDAQQEERA